MYGIALLMLVGMIYWHYRMNRKSTQGDQKSLWVVQHVTVENITTVYTSAIKSDCIRYLNRIHDRKTHKYIYRGNTSTIDGLLSKNTPEKWIIVNK